MPPKARIPAPVLQERNSAQKQIRPTKSRSKERRSLAQQQASSGGQDSRKNFGYGHSNHRNGERSMHELSVQNNEGAEIISQQIEMGSGLKQQRKNGKSSPTVQHHPLIPQQRAIYKLLQSFKLQQYSKNFVELGYGEDVYKLTMMTHRKKQEILDSIEFLPGHKQRLIDLFRRVDNMYPRQNVVRTLENAQRVGSRQGESRMSAVTITDQSSLNVSADKHTQAASRESVNTAHTQAAATASLAMGPNQGNNPPQMLLQTQPVNISQINNSSGIPPPTQFPKRTQNAKSPSSQSKVGKRSNQASSMTRRFNALESGTKVAINESFLMNLRSGKTQATTVQDALKEFYGKDTGAKQSIINKIFASDKKQSQSSVKPHPSLASANKAAAASGSQNGFGLQKFVKVQKGSTTIDKYRSQVSSQGSGKTATKTIQRQSSRTEAQLGRRMDKRAKNSNSSTDSKNLPQPIMIRKGSHQARRKKDTSTSSERREGVTLGMFKVNNRQQLQTQARQQRVTSHSRLQLQQNSNFMMAPSSSRGDFSKQSNKNKNDSQQTTTTGRTRLHRVRSATGYKDAGAQNNPVNASATISSQLNDYSSGSNGPKQVSSQKTAGQQAAMKRIQMHRQRSAKKQITQVQTIDERLQQKQQQSNAPVPTGKPASSSTANMPVFIQQQQRNQPATTTAVRRRVSRDRQQYDFSNNASNSIDDTSGTKKQGESTTTDTTNTKEYNNTDRLNLLRRASSQGASRGANGDSSQKNNVDVIGSQRGVRMSSIHNNNTGAVSSSLNQSLLHAPNSNSIGEAISQSNAFTEYKVITSPAEFQAAQAMPKANANLPPIETKSISSTVKKVINQKAEDIENGSFKSTNAVHPATVSGKPPMSTSKRSMYSSKAESLKTVESVHHSPQKTGTIKGITESSPRRPLVLEPIQNPPTVEVKRTDQTASKTNLIPDVTSNPEQEPPIKAEKPVEQQEKINYEENNIKWSPLLDKSDKIEARDYGYSFGSKKVAMGPGFINLRFMCHCLARAIKRHLEFSKGEHWFLQDLQQEQDDIDLEFSYQLPPDLKLTLNPKGVRISSDDDEDDVNPFQREDQSPVRDIETMDIEVDAEKQKSSQTHKETVRSSATGFGEPEPENIKSSDDGGSGRLSNFKAQDNNHQFSNSKPNQVDDADEIGEEMDEDMEAYSDGFGEEDPEEQSIKEIRREEMRKSVFEKDEKRLNQFIKERKVSELEHQLKSKDKQIKQLTRLVQTGTTRSEIMAISSPAPEIQDEEEGFFDRGVKMDKADWLMAQVDLDPIESHGSMEMSTTKFKSLHGKRFVNSEGGQGALEDSRTSRSTKPPINLTEKKNKKKSQKSYESAFIDVSEDKMREFVMSQLRHFDVRMEYDNLIFNEDQFIPMPSEKYIADYCKYVTIACKMENEIPIVCLVYLEKLLLMTGILLNKWNWRRMVLICLTLASKIWDDDSLENVHFPKVMSDVTNYEINKIEQLFLEFIDYKLVIKGGEYAKYYFILRSMADDINSETQNNVKPGGRSVTAQQAISPFENGKRNSNSKEEWAEFPLKAPISASKMLEIQKLEAKAEVYLKERHEREFLNAFVCHQAGNGKNQTRHPSLLLDRTM